MGALVAALVSTLFGLLAQVSVAVSAPATIAAGEPALVRVEVTAPAAAQVRLVPPDLAPFAVARATRVPSADAGRRRGWRRHEWRYVLAPPAGARGRYAFAPFAAEAAGPGLRPWTVRSRPWALTVRAPSPPPGLAAALGAARGRPGAPTGAPPGAPNAAPPGGQPAAPAVGPGVTFTARVYPDTVYVGQQATYELTVTVDAATRARIRRNPEFVPPELRGVLAVELPATHDASAAGDVHVYRRALFALAPGAVAVPSARLSYALALGASYFSPEERLALRTRPVRFTAVAVPAAGRPPGYAGAVGALRAAARASAPAARAGDPVEYTVRVEGEANVGLLPRPALRVAWADVVDAGDRVEVDSSAPVVRGAKEFTWLLTPRASGAFATPALRYAYFDPRRAAFDTLIVPEVRVDVRPGAAAPPAGPGASGLAAAGALRGDRLPVRTVWRGAFGRPLPGRPAFWLLVAFAPAPAAVVVAARAERRRRALRPVDPARALRRAAAAGAPDVRALRRLVYSAFAARVGFGPPALASADAFGRALRRAGVTEATAARAARLAAALDAAAFDAAQVGDAAGAGALAAEAEQVLADVDREAQSRVTLAASAARVWLVTALVAGGSAALGACAAVVAAGAAGDRAAAAAFARGGDAYARGDVGAARDAFAAAAAYAPTAPDAWANAGTAAWAAGDTVAAAVAWQRAVRLEPAAGDLRARLALLPAAQDGWIAGVPPVAPDWPAYAAAALAAAAAALALARAARGRAGGPGAWPWAWGGAVVAAAASGALAAHANPDARAVVAVGGPLRAEPLLAAEPGPPADPTDVARVLARQGTWARVALDGHRDGWIEAGRLVPLELPPPAPAPAGGR